jgi:predicted HicB family RNase H-like nuclease
MNNNVLHYKGFKAAIEFDAEQKLLCGQILDIAQLITFEGRSVKKVEAAFRHAVDDYTFSCQESGAC